MTTTPPRWAEAILRATLVPRDRETVSGDLLEEYRDSVRPTRGRLRADVWYAGQVAGFVWRSSRMALGGIWVALAISATVPLARFLAPVVVPGGLTSWAQGPWAVLALQLLPIVAVLVAVGAGAVWRTGSMASAAVVGGAATAAALAMGTAGVTAGLAGRGALAPSVALLAWPVALLLILGIATTVSVAGGLAAVGARRLLVGPTRPGPTHRP